MNKLSHEEINRSFADKITPAAKEAYLRVNEPEEAGLLERGKANMGETVLRNTLELIEGRLRQRFGSDEIFRDFFKDQAEIAKIKEQLIKNISSGKGDQREMIVEEVVDRLVRQSSGRSFAA